MMEYLIRTCRAVANHVKTTDAIREESIDLLVIL